MRSPSGGACSPTEALFRGEVMSLKPPPEMQPEPPREPREDPAGRAVRRGAVPLRELCAGFFRMGVLGFGGVAPWARRVIVEERRWLSEEDYAAVLGVSQVLPGANTVNVAVILGDRFQGPSGSVLAVSALMAAPLALLIVIAAVYDRVAGFADVQNALGGVACAAAGLVAGTGVKMALLLRPAPAALLLGAAALLAVAGLKASLLLAVLVLVPAGLALAAAGLL